MAKREGVTINCKLQLQVSGIEINQKLQSQFCDRIPKFSCNLATFSHRIFALHFHVSGLAKLNMSPQYLCVKKLLKMENDRNFSCIYRHV